MIISKAIELLNIFQAEKQGQFSVDELNATQLGTEALKRIKNCRLHPFSSQYKPLPGESMPERGIR